MKREARVKVTKEMLNTTLELESKCWGYAMYLYNLWNLTFYVAIKYHFKIGGFLCNIDLMIPLFKLKFHLTQTILSSCPHSS